MKKQKTLKPVYTLSFIGDLNLSLLQVLNILYGVILGATPLQSGMIGAGYGATYVLMAALLGRLGDKIPRKYSLLAALSCQIGVSLFYILIASSIFHLILGQVILGCAYGFFWPTIEAHISENTSESVQLHQKGISNFCASWSIGYMIGPFLAGIFSDYNVKMGFLMVLLFYFIALSLVIFLIESKKFSQTIPKNPESLTEITPPIGTETPSKIDSLVIRVLFGMLIYAMLGKVILIYFSDYASRPAGLGLTGTIVGILLFSYGIGRTCFFLASRNIESSLKRMNFSYLIIAFFLFSLIFITDTVVLFVIILFMGVCTGLIYKSSLELLLHYEKEAKGAKAGLFESAIGLGSAFSPLIAGIFAEISLILPFIIFGFIALAIFLINLIFELKS